MLAIGLSDAIPFTIFGFLEGSARAHVNIPFQAS